MLACAPRVRTKQSGVQEAPERRGLGRRGVPRKVRKHVSRVATTGAWVAGSHVDFDASADVDNPACTSLTCLFVEKVGGDQKKTAGKKLPK